MPFASHDRLAVLAAREVDAVLVGSQDLPAEWLPTSGGPDLRTPAVEVRQAIKPELRLNWLRKAVFATGRPNYLTNIGKTYKAVIFGRVFYGSFNSVLDQVAPYVLPQLEQCQSNQ